MSITCDCSGTYTNASKAHHLLTRIHTTYCLQIEKNETYEYRIQELERKLLREIQLSKIYRKDIDNRELKDADNSYKLKLCEQLQNTNRDLNATNNKIMTSLLERVKRIKQEYNEDVTITVSPVNRHGRPIQNWTKEIQKVAGDFITSEIKAYTTNWLNQLDEVFKDAILCHNTSKTDTSVEISNCSELSTPVIPVYKCKNKNKNRRLRDKLLLDKIKSEVIEEPEVIDEPEVIEEPEVIDEPEVIEEHIDEIKEIEAIEELEDPEFVDNIIYRFKMFPSIKEIGIIQSSLIQLYKNNRWFRDLFKAYKTNKICISKNLHYDAFGRFNDRLHFTAFVYTEHNKSNTLHLYLNSNNEVTRITELNQLL